MVSLCWISGWVRTVRLANPGAGMGGLYGCGGARQDVPRRRAGPAARSVAEPGTPRQVSAVPLRNRPMLRVSPLVLASLVAAFPLAAQANPFKVRTASRPVAVTYQITGDMTGTADYAASGDKLMTHSTSTGKFFGRTATMDNWTLMTPEEVYHADLAKKRGTKTPNMLPEMAREYDRLSGTDKTRRHQNMSDMAAVLAQAFGATSLGAPENLGSATYAGERCDQRKMGGFTTCVLPYAPQVSLHTSGSLMCVDYDQTATAVRHDVPASAFDPPAGITFA